MTEAVQDAQYISEEDAEKIAEAIEEIDSEIEVIIERGGQPIYYYFVSVE